MLQMIGEIRGIRERTAGEYKFQYLVVEDEEFESHSIQLNKEHDQKFQDDLQKLIGKTCSVPCYIRKYQGKAGTNFSFNYSGSQLPVAYNGTQSMAAVK